MSDKLQPAKLPAWQEQWIDDHELFGCIDAGLVRGFLAQYVLCDREPVAWQVFDGEGNNDLFHDDGNEWCAQNRQKYEGTIYHDWYTPLHTPATEPKP